METRWRGDEYNDYFYESSNRAVLRKTTPSGQVSTIFDREMGVLTGLAIDRSGRLYFSLAYDAGDFASGAIYRLDADGRPTLIAGAATAETARQIDGAGKLARFVEPRDLAIDADDNLYVSEPDVRVIAAPPPRRLRKITPDGAVSTVAALPSSVNQSPDGLHYAIQDNTVVRTNADGGKTVLIGKANAVGTRLGGMAEARLGITGSIVATGPGTFAIATDGALLRLVLP